MREWIINLIIFTVIALLIFLILFIIGLNDPFNYSNVANSTILNTANIDSPGIVDVSNDYLSWIYPIIAVTIGLIIITIYLLYSGTIQKEVIKE